MAEPARRLSDEEQSAGQPYDAPGMAPSSPKPDLKALEGGGEATEPKRGHLREAGAGESSGKDTSEVDKAGGAPDNSPSDSPTTHVYHQGQPLKSRFSIRGRITKKRAIFGSGILGIIVSVIIFFLVSGPLEFVHIAQLLERFHFSALQDQSNDRSLQEFRWIRYKVSGKVHRSNLGTFQNYIADRLESRMSAAGVESVYNNATFGPNGDGFLIDPSKEVGSELGIQGQNEEQIKQFFKENYPDVEISFTDPDTGKAFSDGRFFMNVSKLNSMIFTGHFKIAALNRTFLTASKLNGIASFLGARIMTKRAGATLHAITQEKVINKLSELKFWEGWIDSTKNGTTESINQDGDSVSDPNTIKEAADEVNTGESDVATPANEGSTPDPEGTNTEEGLSLKSTIAKGGTAALAVACVLKGLDSDATKIKETQVVYPLVREATTMIAVGGQVMSGQDLTAAQVGYFKKLLDGPSLKKGSGSDQTSWNEAASIQAELGNPSTGVAPSSTLMDLNKNSPFHFLNTGVAGTVLGGTIGLCSEAAQIIGDVLAPGGALISYIISQFGPVKHLYDDAALWASGQPLNLLDRGADFGNDINFGARLAANAQAVSNGGRMLSGSESNQLSLYEAGQSQQEFDSHSLAYRLFDPYDERSAISKLIDEQDPNPGQDLHSVASALLNFGHIFASIPKLFAATAHAATTTPYDYGFPQYGFSAAEMNSPIVKNPYQNADQVVDTILPEHPQYIQRAQDCFGVTIDPTTYNITSLGTDQIDAGNPDAIKMNFYQQPGAAGYNASCADTSSAWLQVRFYIFDTQTMASTTCYLGKDSDSQTQQACEMVANNQGNTDQTSTPSGTTNPGGLVNPLGVIQKNGSLRAERVDQGVDYSGSGPILAIGAGKILSTTNSGWPGGTFIVIKLDAYQDKYVYVAENCQNILVQVGQHVNAGDKLCTLVNAFPNLEIGWADGQAIGDALAHNVWPGHDSDAYYTAYGKNFSDLLKSLGAPSGTVGPGAKELGFLPAGWPSW